MKRFFTYKPSTGQVAKLSLILLLITFCHSFVFAGQTITTVKGIVQDEKGKPYASATVSLQRAKDSLLVKTEITDATGRYEFANVLAGQYYITVSSSGYNDFTTAVFTLTTGEVKIIETTKLTAAAAQDLGSVVIKAKKPLVEVKADKTVFNVESSINATGSNAMELLQKSPGVVVDKDDNISMKGKNGVKIYIDGRPSQMDNKDLAALLKSMNSSDIEAIEMISNPSAKYDASGNAGIINIRLKKDKRFGMNGNVSVGLMQGITPKTSNAISLNYRNKKAAWFGNYSNFFGLNHSEMAFYRKQADSLFDQKGTQSNASNNHNFKAGVDLFLNPKNTIGFIATGNISDFSFNSSSSTPISALQTGIVNRTLVASNEIPGTSKNFNFNSNYKFADTSGHVFNIDLDYGLFRKKGQSYQPNYYFSPNGGLQNLLIYKNNTPTDIDIYTAKTDYEQNLKGGKLGIGGKVSYVKTGNTFEFWDVVNGTDVKNDARSNTFDYTENINAAYVNYNRPLNQKWSMQAGVRMEHTHSKGKLQSARQQTDANVTRDYVNFFPSAALTYTPSQNHQFTVTYSRRIDRPSYEDLNPFEYKLDELTFQKGNAFLQPQYTNSFEVNHLYKYKLSTTLGYSHIMDLFAQVIDTTENNKAFVTNRNIASQDVYSLNVASPFAFGKVWSGFANANINYSSYKADFGKNRLIDIDVLNYSFNLQNTFSIGKKGLKAELSGWFNGPTVWGGTFKSKSMGGFDAGVQKTILKEKGTIKLTLTDVARLMKWSGISDFNGVYMKASGRWESRQLRLNFSYRFGNSNIKEARQRSTGLESESKRLKGAQ